MDLNEYGKLEERVLSNPHFSEIRHILMKANIDETSFMQDFHSEIQPMLRAHTEDNEVLKDECYSYILPAISIYRTMQKHLPDALSAFREMWLAGAEIGARMLQEKAKDKQYLEGWIEQVTPKNCDSGAFLFEIVKKTATETEYHVKKCPYAELCTAYSCPEIITVFCDSDDIAFGDIHPRLIWGRTKTIGRGSEICDFRYTLLPESKSLEES